MPPGQTTLDGWPIPYPFKQARNGPRQSMTPTPPNEGKLFKIRVDVALARIPLRRS